MSRRWRRRPPTPRHCPRQADDVAALLAERIAAADELRSRPLGAGETDVDRLVAVVRTALGAHQPILPVFTLAAGAELAASAADRAALLGGDETARSRGCTGPASCAPSSTRCAACSPTPRPPAPTSSPTSPSPSSPTGPAPAGASCPSARRARRRPARSGIVAHAPGGFDPTRPLAGLFVDAWAEVIPSAEHTAGRRLPLRRPRRPPAPGDRARRAPRPASPSAGTSTTCSRRCRRRSASPGCARSRCASSTASPVSSRRCTCPTTTPATCASVSFKGLVDGGASGRQAAAARPTRGIRGKRHDRSHLEPADRPARPRAGQAALGRHLVAPRTAGADADLTAGLQALLGDPLWLIGRQWQFGELRGEDAGTPISAIVEVEQAPLSRLRRGSSGAPIDLVDESVPLEARIEAEPVPVPAERVRAEAGLQLLRRLAGAGLGTLRDPGRPAVGVRRGRIAGAGRSRPRRRAGRRRPAPAGRSRRRPAHRAAGRVRQRSGGGAHGLRRLAALVRRLLRARRRRRLEPAPPGVRLRGPGRAAERRGAAHRGGVHDRPARLARRRRHPRHARPGAGRARSARSPGRSGCPCRPGSPGCPPTGCGSSRTPGCTSAGSKPARPTWPGWRSSSSPWRTASTGSCCPSSSSPAPCTGSTSWRWSTPSARR